MKKLEAFVIARKTRDEYRRIYEKLEAERKGALKEIQDCFRPGARMQEEIRTTNEKYDRLLDDNKLRLKLKFDEAVEKARAQVNGKISFVPDNMKVLNALMEMPVTTREFGVLANAYGKRNPWMDRQLMVIAERNNITIDKDVLDPVPDRVLDALDCLEGGIHAFLEKDRDDIFDCITVDSMVSNATLDRLEDSLYTEEAAGYTSTELVRRGLTRVAAARNFLEQVIMLENFWKHATNQMQQNALAMLAGGEFPTIHDDTIRSASDVQAAWDKFDMEEYRGSEMSKQAVKKLVDEFNKWGAENMQYHEVAGVLEHVPREYDKYLEEAVANSDVADIYSVQHYMEVRKTVNESRKTVNESRKTDSKAPVVEPEPAPEPGAGESGGNQG